MSSELDTDRLAVLIHEVRSPVAALSAIAETVSDGGLDTVTRQELVRLVMLACRGIERIVGDVAVASVRLEEVDPSALVRDVAVAARLRGWRVEAEIPQRAVPRIQADPSRLRQVLDNLLANAVVHGGKDGVVRLRLGVDDSVVVEVIDAGPGIPAAELERIFDVGVRLEADRPGTGLGLAVSRAIVEAHGGALTATSAPGRGTTMIIALPLTG
ncbi:MAG TPA: HAMP domain-containing sensor histidine kinase [Gaiellaceae bacterium]|nr:HAMP domain-containing sensor histidine kinase [Gaiellaceae bacterium]